MKFTELELVPEMLKAIEAMGFEEMTAIQEQTIPLALNGGDVIGQAQTGTGKTAAFGIPMLQKVDVKNRNVQGLVIAPTRELAIQTQEELYRLSRGKRVNVQVVYGGADIRRQIRALNDGPHIVVGTPGRLLDHIKRKTLKLDRIETLVLDEADEMLNMGFIDDIESIVKQTPTERQTLLFSATMPEAIKQIALRFMKKPDTVRIKTKTLSAANIKQFYTKSKDAEKFDILSRLIDVQEPEAAIIFARTKRRVDELAKGLEMRGYNAEGIHGDLSQGKRMSVLKAFKNSEMEILVATDVAARGLDISGVTHVYNYDIPQDPESYVHRIGRTGRAGADGMSVTFVTPSEMGYLRTIERITKQEMSPLRPPTVDEALESQVKTAIDEIESLIKKDQLNSFEDASAQLMGLYSKEELAVALVKAIVKDPNEVPVKITPERPLPSRGGRGGGYKGKRGGRGGGYKGKRSGRTSGGSSGDSRRSRDSDRSRSGGRKRFDKKK